MEADYAAAPEALSLISESNYRIHTYTIVCPYPGSFSRITERCGRRQSDFISLPDLIFIEGEAFPSVGQSGGGVGLEGLSSCVCVMHLML